MVRIGGVIGLIALVVWLYAIFDAITAPAERVRTLPKAVWVIIVLLFADLGAIAWFLLGRPRERGFSWPSTAGPSIPGPAAPRRSVAPDDDPEFLRRLGDDLRRPKPDAGDEPRA